MAILGLAAPASAAAADGAKPGFGAQLRSTFAAKTPRSPALAANEADAAVARLAVEDPCRAMIRDELIRGERPDPAADRCAAARDRVLVRLARRQRASFGLVDRREEDLARISVLLSHARRCRRWLLSEPGRSAPILADALAAKCAVRRYRGPLAVAVVDAAGQRTPVLEIRPQRDGRYVVRYAEVDAALGHRGQPRLVAWERLELGVGGWAGTVDLAAGRREARDRHAKAVLTGRGVPALFVVRHPEHPAADDARLLAEESRLLRKQGDYEAVVGGTMSPRRFLARYVISRYHRAVREIERGGSPTALELASPKETCPEGQGGVEGTDPRGPTTEKNRANAEAPTEGAAAPGSDGCRSAATAPPPADPRP
jgi:hypothetical protein